jgi:hypothetical protein
VIHLHCETTLEDLRNRHGNIVGSTSLTAAEKARAERNRDTIEAFQTHVLPHTETLLTAARTALDAMPPARPHTGWKLLLDDLAHAAGQIHRILAAAPSPPEENAAQARDVALSPYLLAWAERSSIVSDLAEQHRAPAPPLSGDKQQQWTERAHAAWRRGELEASERWYDAEGRLITLAYLIEHDDSTVLVLAGEPGTPQMQVLGHYDTEYEAGQSSPPQVPAGVLRPDASVFTPRIPEAEVSVGELTQLVTEAQHSADVAEALLAAAEDSGHERGPLARMGELLQTAAEFSDALETRQGQRSAVRLGILAQQLGVLAGELQSAAEELGSAVGVLPPHRTPRPRFLTAPSLPALTTTPPVRPAGHSPSSSALHR